VKRGKPTAILIAGPTASGKSALAIDIAREIGGAVVNADSMQVYADLHVLTARPSPAEEAVVAHRLYGHVDGAVNYSVGKWLGDLAIVLDELRAQRQMPVIVGGTGLYFKALLSGLSDIPLVPEEMRARLRQETANVPTRDLHGRLGVVDPQMAVRLAGNDRQRILRGLEVHEATGRPLSSWLSRKGAPLLAAETCAKVFLACERKDLVGRIDARFVAMMKAGALAEVERLRARRLDAALPVMRAHGVPGLIAHLEGRLAIDAAITLGQADTRAYAKRQMTWFRHQMPDFQIAAPDKAAESLRKIL
jgi:tRNA dimethylallyltransferase